MVKRATFYSTDRHLELRLKPYQTPFTSPREHFHLISRLSSASFPQTGSCLWSHAHAAGDGGGGVLLRGLDQADYLLTASRTACNIPSRLLRSPPLICPNKPGLAVSQKDQVTIWTSKGGKGVTWHPATEVEATTWQMLLTNVHWAYSSHILGWSTGFYWRKKKFVHLFFKMWLK